MKRGGVLAVSAVAAIIVLYYIFDPSGEYAPKCMFRTLTGLDCPGCGSQRMLHALLHGDFKAAWRLNPFIMLMGIYAVPAIYAACTRRRAPRLYNAMNSLWAIAIIGIAMLAWFLIRNFVVKIHIC
ncbi:MAG: DUF2752 domain-containing protein [Candidatus Amulumruptor caecigallinarius]|nr:DUF2752 domain-containing protein [Candidatus Amulumruptor caecigallinarius]